MAEQFDRILDEFDSFDDQVAATLRELEVHSPVNDLTPGSSRVTPVCTSERMVRHFQAHYQLTADVGMMLTQERDRARRIRTLAATEGIETEAA